MEVHLPTADTQSTVSIESLRFEEIPLTIPNQESRTDRRRIFAETGVVHDASGDAAMEQNGTGDWVFPQERSPQPFTG